MPGIVGLITKMPREEAVLQLAQMVGALRHEPFYTTGTWIDESSGVYIGWITLNGSFSERMPLRNERGEVVLVFSGEEFPEPGTAQRLKKQGHKLDVDGPSYLVHLYEEEASFPAGLNGRFHGFLVDQNRGTAVLFNDRYGMHRIYYHQSKESFYFAAEGKAILAVRPELRRMDSRGLGEFIACGAVLENRTIFDGMQVLPPGSAWVFRNRMLNVKSSYFHPREWEEQDAFDPESFYKELREVFMRNLPRYFSGYERIAMSLTGGLDTRMILACRKPDPGSLPCYTFGSMYRENRDVRVARRVAEACGQSHHVITAGEEFLSKFAEYASRTIYLSEGCVDVGRTPDLYLNERAREIAPVRMTGNYGGEILRGVIAFKPSEPASEIFSPECVASMHGAAETYRSIRQGHPLSFAMFCQAPWYLQGVLTVEQSQVAIRSPYLDNEFVRTVYRGPASALANGEASLRLVADGNRALLKIPTDRGLTGRHNHPFDALSRAMLEFSFKAEYAYDMGMPQWLARIDHKLAWLRLHRFFLGRHKPFHFRVWYRDTLADYLKEVLLDPCSLSRPYLDRKGIVAAVEEHIQGKGNHTNEIHKVLALELIHRLFFEHRTGEEPHKELSIVATCTN